MPRLGRERVRANRERFQITQEALGGIKEVKMLDLERRYLARFVEPSRRLARVKAHAQIAADMPRFALEGVAFSAMVLFVIWLLRGADGSLEAALPTLGAYAFAGVRLFPAMQDIFRSITRIRFGAPAIAALREDLSGPGPRHPGRGGEDGPPVRLRRVLALEEVTFRYPGAEAPALAELSLEVEAGTAVGIVGPTGAGKSTLVDLILGLLEPDEGLLTADGVALRGEALRRWRRSVGYVPQSIFLTDDTIAANVAFGETEDEIDMEPRGRGRAPGAARRGGGRAARGPHGPGGRARRAALGRPAPAHWHRARALPPTVAAGARRGDERVGLAHRACSDGDDRWARRGDDRHHDRPPPVERAPRRPHRDAGGRAARRRGPLRRARGALGRLPPPPRGLGMSARLGGAAS